MSDRYYKYLSNSELSNRYKLANLCDHSGFVRYPDGSKVFRRLKGRRERRAQFHAARSAGLRRWVATQAFLSAAGWKRFGCLKSRLDTVCEKTADTTHYRLWATSKATVSANGRLRTSFKIKNEQSRSRAVTLHWRTNKKWPPQRAATFVSKNYLDSLPVEESPRHAKRTEGRAEQHYCGAAVRNTAAGPKSDQWERP